MKIYWTQLKMEMDLFHLQWRSKNPLKKMENNKKERAKIKININDQFKIIEH